MYSILIFKHIDIIIINTMRVQKRNGNLEDVSFDKVMNRLKKFCCRISFLCANDYV